MIQKNFFRIAAVIALMLLLIPLNSSIAIAKSDKVTINWADPSPNKGLRPEYLVKAAKAVEDATEGRVKINFFWSQSLVPIKETLPSIKQGLCDAGWVGSAYNPREFPLTSFASAFLYHPKARDSSWIVEKTFEMYEKSIELQKELEGFNAQLWFVFPYAAYPMLSNKKVNKIEDFKGMIIRTSGEYPSKFVEAAGARAESIPATEIYSALDKNTVDAAIADYDYSYRYNLHEVSSYLIDLNVFMNICEGPVRIDKLNQMSPEDRKVFMDIGREYSLKYAKALDDSTNEIIEIFRKAGMEKLDFPDSEREKWAQLPEVKNGPNEWVENEEKRGVPARRVMELWREIANVKN